MTLDEAIKHAEEVAEKNEWFDKNYLENMQCRKCAEEHRQLAEWLKELKQLREQTSWIPIKTRQMTEEEKEECECEYPYMYDCPLPNDGQDVFITTCRGNVTVDTFCRDYEGCYFETYCDDGDVIAWMPLPESYKASEEQK